MQVILSKTWPNIRDNVFVDRPISSTGVTEWELAMKSIADIPTVVIEYIPCGRCEKPIPQIPGRKVKRYYCNETCKDAAYKKRMRDARRGL